jgi:hypothetical protein
MSTLEWTAPRKLDLTRRFDIAAKYQYALAFKNDSLTSYHRQAYEEHIRVFNAFFEKRDHGGPPKKSAHDFVSDFDRLLEAIAMEGFDETNPITIGPDEQPHDGAHRISACLAFGRDLACRRIERPFSAAWGFKFFRDRGMDPAHLDFAAAALGDIFERLRIVVVFGSALNHAPQIASALEHSGQIVYARRVELSSAGCDNLIRVLYEGERWLGRREFGYLGASGKSRHCFPQGAPRAIECLWFSPSVDDEGLIRAKEDARRVVGLGKHSLHINDSTTEAATLSDWLLNENGRHLLNHKRYRYFPGFERELGELENRIMRGDAPRERICVVGSSSLSAYGLRAARDLDIIEATTGSSGEQARRTENANQHWQSHGFSIDELIFSPQDHFKYRGIKFVSLSRVAELKAKRGEYKDKVDLALIDSVLRRRSRGSQHLARIALLIKLYSNTRFLRSYVGHWISRIKHRVRASVRE